MRKFLAQLAWAWCWLRRHRPYQLMDCCLICPRCNVVHWCDGRWE
jgi:hypothetical protein